MKKNIIYSFIMIIAMFVLSSCGADSKADGEVSKASTNSGGIQLAFKSVNVDKNTSNMVLNVKLTSNYDSSIRLN